MITTRAGIRIGSNYTPQPKRAAGPFYVAPPKPKPMALTVTKRMKFARAFWHWREARRVHRQMARVRKQLPGGSAWYGLAVAVLSVAAVVHGVWRFS